MGERYSLMTWELNRLVDNIEDNSDNTDNDSDDTKGYLHDYQCFIGAGDFFFRVCLCSKNIFYEQPVGKDESENKLTYRSCKLDKSQNSTITKECYEVFYHK